MKKAFPYLITAVLLLALAGIGGKIYLDRYTYSNERADLDAYYGVQGEDDFPVIYENLVSEMHALRIGKAVYMDFDTVRSLLNGKFYYGEEDGTLLYCLPEERFLARAGEKGWESDVSGRHKEKYAPAVLRDGTLYVALDYVRKFTNFYYAAYTGPNRVVLRTSWGKEQMATVRGDTNMRTLGGVKAPIIAAVEEGTDVLILDPIDGWTRIETADGFYGYVENKYLSEAKERRMEPVADVEEPEVRYRTVDGRVCIAWNMISFTESNESMPGMLTGTKSINVLSPTWFTLVDEDGEMNVKASKDYVEVAHGRGMMVWPVLDNFQNEKGLACTQFLRTLAGRERVIKEAVGQAKAYGADGINLDFEGLYAEDGEDFVEFVREFCIACRREGLYSSVDNYVPYDFNDYYDLEEQARFADYVVLMGYDEHFAGSEAAGSVASIGYVRYGIEEALQEVPAGRLINGIPFYTRGWTTEGDEVSSVVLDMVEAKAFVADHDMEKEWNSTAGQYYAEKQSGEKLYQIWIEDKKSIRKKLEVMDGNGLAGVAVWVLGSETNDVWDEIDDFVKKKK